MKQFHQTHARRRIIVVITGTDWYRSGKSKRTQQSLQTADRIVVLQSATLRELPKSFRTKARVIHQSVTPLALARPKRPRQLNVVVAGHLRPVKDPFRTAHAVRSLAAESRIQVQHCGAAMSPAMESSALAEMKRNARYHWLGEIARGELRRRLATCWLMVLSSKMEGGANVLSEAIVSHTPVLASSIPGSIGLLGKDYDGYFETGNTHQLRSLLERCERDEDFIRQLSQQVSQRAGMFSPHQEQIAWRDLLSELS